MRRFIRFLGPYEIQPLVLGPIMGLFFLTYALGLFSGRYSNDPELITYGLLPAVVIGALIGLMALGFRAVQRRFGVTWVNFLGALVILGFVASIRGTMAWFRGVVAWFRGVVAWFRGVVAWFRGFFWWIPGAAA